MKTMLSLRGVAARPLFAFGSVHKKPTKFQTKLFINNQFVDGVKKNTINVINPTTEEVTCKISEATQEDVELAISAAQAAFPAWSKTAGRDKSKLLHKLADLIERDFDELIRLESLDNGKPIQFSKNDITEVIISLRYFAGWADKTTGKTFPDQDGTVFSTRREPFGVVGLISPWNFPLLMCEWKFAPALAAGNCVVHKPSEETPLTILKLCELFKEAGFPAGVYNCVPGYGHSAGETIARSRRVSKVSFTGSTAVGRKILEASAQTNLKKVTLELGGKSPVIVCPDSDLEKAADLAWSGIMYNMGQCCIAGSRLLVHESVYDKLLAILKKKQEDVKIGCAFDGCNHGPQVNLNQLNKILGYFDHAKNVEKLDLLIGGEKHGDKGYFIQPTIYYNVPDDSKLASEEIFGPVLSVLTPWKTLDEVIARANNTKYGLAAVVLSNNPGITNKLVNELQAGTIFVNTYCIPESFIPFGGYKESGFGRDNGEEAILEYTQVKSVYHKIDPPTL